MHPATRTQVDDLFEEASEEAKIFFPEKSRTRQEFKDEADVNTILRRFGVAPQRPVQYSAIDFDMDLQQALHAVRDAKAAHATLDKELRDRYPTWQSLLTALEAGELTLSNEPAPKEEKPDAGAAPQPA